MPLPQKQEDESKSTFVSRCMSDDIMKKEFPKDKQRVAVCHSQYSKRKATKGTANWGQARKGDILGLI
jgi:hypothetical protein